MKFCARVLRSSPGFTALAVLTLALGIGATTAMFSVIDNVLLEPFPYAHQNRLVSLVIHDAASSEAGGRSMFPAAEFLDIREQNRVFDDCDGRWDQPCSVDDGWSAGVGKCTACDGQRVRVS